METWGSDNQPEASYSSPGKGRCCKVCGSVVHLVKDCPEKLNRDSAPTKRSIFDATPRGTLTKFSGDDLEDDYMKSLKAARRSRAMMMILKM
ncbi:unnamed protein product [Brassica oleracea]